MILTQLLPLLVTAAGAGVTLSGGGKALTAVEARKRVGEKITVGMTVQAAKDRLSRGGIPAPTGRRLGRTGRCT
jgi:hypothetical protein